MRFFQILDCSEALGTCCTDYGLLTILDVSRKVLDLIQLIAPIILMVALAIQFTQLLVNPDDKKKTKSLLNKFIAALLCFFVPYLVDLSLSLLPSDIETFQLGACWDTAKISRELLKESNSTYVSTSNKQPQSFMLSTQLPNLSQGILVQVVLLVEQLLVMLWSLLDKSIDTVVVGMEKNLIHLLIVVVLYRVCFLILVFNYLEQLLLNGQLLILIL